jgi:hypothetical protein
VGKKGGGRTFAGVMEDLQMERLFLIIQVGPNVIVCILKRRRHGEI